jgi:hypothetical protein
VFESIADVRNELDNITDWDMEYPDVLQKILETGDE